MWVANWQESTFAKHEATRLREHLLAATAYNARQRNETVPLVKLIKLFKMRQANTLVSLGIRTGHSHMDREAGKTVGLV